MAILKCKMCGGDIELAADKTFGTCEYCGSTMTLPKIDDEQRAAAFNRGNHFRRIGEFDKALAVYERIVRENENDAEAHWCCALCRFGIEYVEDPATYEYLPTCHRASFDSFLEDVDYLAALEHSEGITNRQYQKDAAKIAEVQRGILATSQNTEPYDVFICYKESDENGNRTKDSLMAQDIYYQLTDQGRKVFFSRITLEDVVGTQYEPYIFAALNSAKVMVVVGTKPEYLNAVWVKNEWSRFLAMMKKDRHKLLLPCYRDMDPYDMPEQLSVLQSYDTGKIGFIQDLTRGIAKVLDAEKKPEPVKETVVVQQTAPATNTAPLLKRAYMFLEDGEWVKADEFCEQVLNIDPECAEAYLGKLMAELRVDKRENLANRAESFNGENNYQKAIRFGNDELVAELKGYITQIHTRKENARLDAAYSNALMAMSAAATIKEYETAIKMFEGLDGWKDTVEKISICHTKIAEIKAKEEAARLELARQEEIKRKKAEEKAKRNKKIAAIVVPVVCVITAFVIVLNSVIIPNGKYNNAIALMDAQQYTEAIAAFEAMEGYKDSSEKIEECNELIQKQTYNDAIALMDAQNYTEAILEFVKIAGYEDSTLKIKQCNELIQEQKYNDAVALTDAGKYEEAYEAFAGLGEYKDSAEKASALHKKYVLEKLFNANVGDYILYGSYEQDNNTENGKEDIQWLVLGKQQDRLLVISRFALDYLGDNNGGRSFSTWDTSYIRNWLNSSFRDTAFTAEELSMIPTVSVPADRSPDSSVNQGTVTQDKIFLLSTTEAEKYFDSENARICKGTKYAQRGEPFSVTAESHPWLLRTRGNIRAIQRDFWYGEPEMIETHTLVSGSGSILSNTDIENGNILICIRPAMWIDMSAA